MGLNIKIENISSLKQFAYQFLYANHEWNVFKIQQVLSTAS